MARNLLSGSPARRDRRRPPCVLMALSPGSLSQIGAIVLGGLAGLVFLLSGALEAARMSDCSAPV